MLGNNLVSVNITTYNRSHLISRCIDSVLSQSYKNLEIVIVDDCSNDNTIEILQSYQEKDARVNYLKHETNKGNAYSRNTALKNCTGYYVAFIDDDDEWIDKDKIKKQIYIFENSNDKRLAIVCSGILRYQENGDTIEEKAYYPNNIKDVVLKGGFIHNSTVIIRKSIMNEVGEFDINVKRGVDSEFFRRIIIMFNYDVYFMEDITSKYYEDSLNRMTLSKNCTDYLKHLNSQFVNIKKYFKYLIVRPSILFSRVKTIFILSAQYLKCVFINID